jgi:hypothetical protein
MVQILFWNIQFMTILAGYNGLQNFGMIPQYHQRMETTRLHSNTEKRHMHSLQTLSVHFLIVVWIHHLDEADVTT